MKNKLLAFAIAASVSFSAYPAVYAMTDSADSKVVRFLTAFDIMGTDEITNFFWDNTPVKRSEMAQILCSVFDLEVAEDDKQRFSDVSGEYRKFVETIVRYGVMSGYSETTFGPEDYITNQQLVKIVVSMMGAGAVAESRGGYPAGYTNVAEELELIVGTGSLNSVARRIDVAELLYNAMHSDFVKIESYYNGFANYETVEDKTFLTERLGIYRFEGIVSQNAVTSLARPGGVGENLVMVGDEVCLDKDGLLEDYFGANVTVYVKKEEPNDNGEVIYVEENKKNKSITIADEDILPNDGNTFKYYENSKTKSLSLSPVADMIYNGVAIDKDLSKLNVKNGFVKLIDNNSDKVYDVIIVTDYNTYVVESVNAENEKIVLQFGESVMMLKNLEYKIFKDGKRATIAELKKGDVLSVAVSEDGKVLRIDASTESFTGVAESVNEEGVIISGNEYEISEYFNQISQKGKISEIMPGTSGEYCLDVMGKIVYYTTTVSGNTVGYLVDYNYNDEDSDGVLTVEIFTGNANIERFQFDKTVRVNGLGAKTEKLVLNAEFMTNLDTPQLVEYEAENGILKNIAFGGTVPSPDSVEFSLDAQGSFKASATGIFEHKYRLSDKTKVFLVPSNSNYFGNESYYELRNGPYFSSTETRNLSLYDIDEFGNVKYVVTKYDPQWSQIGYGNGLALIISKSKGIGTDGSIVDVFECMNEAGQKITIKTDDYSGIVKNKKVRTFDSDGKVLTVAISKDEALELSSGDVIQYKTNQSGYIHSVVVQHKAEDNIYYTPESIEPNNTNTGVPNSVYGKVMRNDGEQLLLTCDKNADISEGIEVADKLICNTGKAIFKVYRGSGRATVEQIEFSDILPEDNIFASVSTSNTTKMIVIYE